MDVTSPSLRKPIKADIAIQSRPEQLASNILIDIPKPNIKLVANAEIKRDSERINYITLLAELKSPSQNQYMLKTEKVSGEKLELALTSNGKKILELEQSQNGQREWRAKLSVPSRELEANSVISDKEVSFSVYPRKDRKEKYHVKGYYEGKGHLFGGVSLLAGAELMYPGLEKPVQVKSNVDVRESASKGTIELDLFNDPQEKMRIEVSTIKLAKLSYKADMLIQKPVSSIILILDYHFSIVIET